MKKTKILTPLSPILASLLVTGCGCNDQGAGNEADGDTDGSPFCFDFDGDGHGQGCEEGPDCDDHDPLIHDDCTDCHETHAMGCACEEGDSFMCYDGHPSTLGVGQCVGGLRSCVDGQLGPCVDQVLPAPLEDCEDGVDNNCNGEADEEWLCGGCTEPCFTDGEQEPGADDPGATGLVPNPDGPGVTLGQSDEQEGFAWIANSAEGTVSKLDIMTGTELARYRVGLSGTEADRPSRTAVDDYQNAYVANRAFDLQGSVTKIASTQRYCVDRNANGEIETSTDSTALPLGEDECVLWTSQVGDVNGIPRALVVDFGSVDYLGGHPWVGNFNEQRFYRLDPADGAILDEVQLDVNTYGAAIDSDGWIWVSGRNSHAIQRFHYMTHEVQPAIDVPLDVCQGTNPYGITIDREDRVWIGVWDEGGACRYDPETESWFLVDTGGLARGVAVDEENHIWASNDSAGTLYRFDADDGADLEFWTIPGTRPIGVGVDRYTRVWTINQESNDAARFDRTTVEFDSFPVGSGPYTYSDFLGYQRWLMIPRGIWVQLFERCDESEHDRWLEVIWDTETPDDSLITLVGRSAATPGGILSAPEVVIAEIGPVDSDVGGKDLESIFDAEGVELERFIEITVYMEPGMVHPVAPVFHSMQVFYYCTSLV